MPAADDTTLAPASDRSRRLTTAERLGLGREWLRAKAADGAAETDPLLGKTVAGRFTVLSRLGCGSMGAVYRARQNAMGREVALKIVRRDRASDSETRVRFEREARATSALTSVHTVTVFDFGEDEDGSWFLAMELLSGETLGDRLRRVKRLPLSEASRIARQALASLAEAHAKGIVHRDLKPDNIFLCKLPDADHGELCKVLDFGIAKVLGVDARVDPLETQAGTVFGTPRYMSPEQAQGLPLDPRSDLYAVGLLLFQMLTGRAPFVDDDAVVVMARHIKDPPPPFASIAPELDLPDAVEQVVRRALAKDPADRPQSAEEFLAELLAVDRASSSATGSHWTSWGGPSSGAGLALRPQRWRWAGGLLSVLAVGVLAVAAFRPAVPVTLKSDGARRTAAAAPAVHQLRPHREEAASSAANRAAPATRAPEALPDAGLASPKTAPSASSSPNSTELRARQSSRSAGRQGGEALTRKGGERYGRFE